MGCAVEALGKSISDLGAPFLATVVGGPAGTTSGVLSLLSNAFGVPAEPARLLAAVQADPEARAKLSHLEITFERYLAEVRLRQDQAENPSSQPKPDKLYLLAWFVVAGFVALIAATIFFPVAKEDGGLVTVLIGTYAAGFNTVLHYFFGSSAGSARKEDTLTTLAARPAGFGGGK